MAEKPRLTQSLKAALTSWRLGAVTLLMWPSGMPLGLVLTAVPAWMAMSGVDIKTIGLLTLAQAPYAFKFLWAPLLDRYRLPLLGRKRGWVFAAQALLAALTFALGATASSLQVGAVAALTLLISFASASQDIATDAYAVEVLKPEEHGLAVGARTTMYRVGFWAAGNVAISLAPYWGWSATLWAQAALYLAFLPVTALAPEPEQAPPPPRSLKDAVWEPFVGFLQKQRALEIVAFVVCYKLSNNLAVALIRPFLVQLGFDAFDVGIASGSIGIGAAIVGSLIGGVASTRIGVGRALWAFGVVQMLSNLGYAALAQAGPTRWLLYTSVGVEYFCDGLGVGAFGVLLLRLTQKRFSATQYALFSSVFAVGRTVSGPLAGALVASVGWTTFFLLTVPAGIPGLVLLHRFAPLGRSDLPAIEEDAPLAPPGKDHGTRALVGFGLLWAVLGALLGVAASLGLSFLRSVREQAAFAPLDALWAIVTPSRWSQGMDLAAALLFGVLSGIAAAAYLAARRPRKASAP